MMRNIDSGRPRWISMAIMVCLLAGCHAGALGQEVTSAVPAVEAIPRTAVSHSETQHELLNRLRRMEERLDQVTKHNEELAREVQELKSANRDQSQRFPP
jgi:hypothetical protein